MVNLNNVSFSYLNNEEIINDINLNIEPGQCILLCGESGCGKTTVTKLINGIIPHFIDDYTLSGNVVVNKKLVAKTKMYELSKKIGSVFQNPKSQFFNLDTDSEIVFGLENEGIAPSEIDKRFKRTVNELEIQKLLHRNIFSLSGGEKQLLAFASVYAMDPQIIVLDEPSANLDVKTIDVLKRQLKHVKEMGHTIIIAEHRFYFLLDIIDKAIYLKDGQIKEVFDRNEFKAISEAKRINLGLRSLTKTEITVPKLKINYDSDLYIKDISYNLKGTQVLENVNISANCGDIIGIVGHNGRGKSTFCRSLCGLIPKAKGNIIYKGEKIKLKNCKKKCSLVMQDVNHQLFSDSVWNECCLSSKVEDEKEIKALLEKLDLYDYKDSHPMALSGGQKQRLAIADAVVSKREIICFDEPTSGLDYKHMIEVSKILKKLSAAGHIIFVVTHDYEFLNLTCNYYVDL
ncbi:MAG: ABC transporter ATP-binding protein [Clostridiaceae bacterium]|nr:ABC transporter ATP-binding protein [Clostridiaceae bacterium]